MNKFLQTRSFLYLYFSFCHFNTKRKPCLFAHFYFSPLPFGFVTTVHKDVTERLRGQNRELFERVRTVLDKNKAERHMRGGEATKQKYIRQKSRN
ncbi:MAG: sporulation transcriptional regulator SpoIIID [Clostridia bacterium]|nr:sporulation transcriptional regulator SpoIIID [Clostridia bacterium]